MTTDKARKRAVRTRMTKTGESYTTARRQVAREGDAPAPAATRLGAVTPGPGHRAATAASCRPG